MAVFPQGQNYTRTTRRKTAKQLSLERQNSHELEKQAQLLLPEKLEAT